MTVDITPISSADYPTARYYLDINNRAREVDLSGFPPYPEYGFRVSLDLPWPGQKEEKYLAWRDGVAVGLLEVGLPQRDNLLNMHIGVIVAPEFRRQGVGTELIHFATKRAHELGRARLVANSATAMPGSGEPADPAPAAFATHFGFKPVLTEVHRTLALADVDDEVLDRMLAESWSHAEGYRLVRWQGNVPEELIEDTAYLDGRLSTDAPMGDMTVEAQNVDADLIREADATTLARGRRGYHTGLVHTASGRFICWTTICAETGVDWHAWQQITIVDPDHRGHRLGTIAKIENLRWFRESEPQVTHIGTFNAASNSYMIAINEAMGFRARNAFENWELEL